LINQQIKALKKVQHYRVETLKRDRQAQGKSISIIGPTVNLLPFASSPKFGQVSCQSHILSAGTTDDIMMQIHLLADTPATVDFDANMARYNQKDTMAIQQSIFEFAKLWSELPTQTLSELIKRKVAQ
jgi:hypothetical protein